MVPNLELFQHERIRHMITSKFANAAIARTVRCNTRSVQTIWSNPRCLGNTPRRTITPPMLNALLQQLIKKPELYEDNTAVLLYDKFEVVVTSLTISRALALVG